MYRTFPAILVVTFAAPALAHGTGVHAFGTVSQVSEARIVVDTAKGPKNFEITPTTRFSKQGMTCRWSDVKPGARVVVHGNDVHGAHEATEVRIGQEAMKEGHH